MIQEHNNDRDALDAARVFTEAAHAHTAAQGADALAGYLYADTTRYVARLAGMLSVGGFLVSHQAAEHFSGPGEALVSLSVDASADPHEVAAVQVVSCHLNGNADAAADVIAAHRTSAGTAGMVQMLAALLVLSREFVERYGVRP